MRRGRAGQLPEFAHHAHQRIDLQRFARLDILQHRGLESAEFARHGVPVLGLLRDRQTDLLANGLGFQHHGRDKAEHQLVAQDAVGGGARQCADRVDGQVAPQLEPDVALDAGGGFHLNATARQPRGQVLHPRAQAAIGLTQNQTVAEMLLHCPGRLERAAGVYDAAHHMGQGQGAPNGTVGIHRVQGHAPRGAAKAVQEPPRDAVHRRQHQGVGAEQRRQGLGYLRQGRGFDGHHHQILHAQCLWVVMGGHSRLRHCAIGPVQLQSMGAQGGQRGATCHHAHLVARLGQGHAQPSTNGTCAVNACFHGCCFRIQ